MVLKAFVDRRTSRHQAEEEPSLKMYQYACVLHLSLKSSSNEFLQPNGWTPAVYLVWPCDREKPSSWRDNYQTCEAQTLPMVRQNDQNTSFLPHTLYSSILVKCVVCDAETLKQERPQEIGMVFVRTQKFITRSPAQSRGCKRSKELPVQQESRVPRHPW